MKPISITWLLVAAVFLILFAGSCQDAQAGTIASFDSDGWSYDLTDRPYQDERLGYATEAARRYWGALPAGYRVLVLVATPTAPQEERGAMAIGIQRPVNLDDRGAIWINEAYYADRIEGKRVQNRANLCTTVVHEVRHSLDPRTDLDPHRVITEDPDRVMQGFTPSVCNRLTAQDLARRAQRRCKVAARSRR